MLTLRQKIRGCIAGSWVGSAMGAAVEGWPRERIVRTYGTLQELRPYKHYTAYTDWERLPGTTEDGIERQKLMNLAVIRKQDRITADDLVATWIDVLDPDRMCYKQEPFDRSLLEMARAGVPARELGRLWPFNNVVSMARASHTLGIINAGDPAAAAADVYDVGLVYAAETTFALRWAALYDAAVAEALRPGATLESVLDTARTYAAYRSQKNTPYGGYDRVEQEVERALEIGARYQDPLAMWDELAAFYAGGDYVVYGQAQANEIVAKGLAIVAATGGRLRPALIAAVNYGRDTDCLAAVVGGLAGALCGAEELDPQWIAQVNAATKADPYTNSLMDIDETSEGLFRAVRNRVERQRRTLAVMEDAPQEYWD